MLPEEHQKLTVRAGLQGHMNEVLLVVMLAGPMSTDRKLLVTACDAFQFGALILEKAATFASQLQG